MEARGQRIGLVADTHVPGGLPRLPSSLLQSLDGVAHIIHAGDLTAWSVLEALQAVAPTTAVAGNCDPPDVASRLPIRITLTLGGCTVGVHHGHQRHALQSQYVGCPYDAPEFDLFYQAMAAQLPNSDVIVFGHFHAPVVRVWNGILFVNPGSIAPPHARPTYAILNVGAPPEARLHLVS